MLRCAIADVTFVRRIGLRCRNGITVVVVDQQQSVIINTGMLITIELTDLSTFLYTEEVLAGTRTWFLIQIQISHLICIARQFGQLGLAHTPVNACGPFEIFLGQHIVVKRHFDTCILGGTHIHQNSVVDEWRLWSGIVVEQILRTTVEILDTSTQTTVKCNEIDTNVEGS